VATCSLDFSRSTSTLLVAAALAATVSIAGADPITFTPPKAIKCDDVPGTVNLCVQEPPAGKNRTASMLFKGVINEPLTITSIGTPEFSLVGGENDDAVIGVQVGALSGLGKDLPAGSKFNFRLNITYADEIRDDDLDYGKWFLSTRVNSTNEFGKEGVSLTTATVAVTDSAVPEPSSWTMLCSGLALLWRLKSRARQTSPF